MPQVEHELKHLLSAATPEDKAELIEILNKDRRNQQRAKFIDYCCSKELFPEEKTSHHQQLLCHYLQMVEQGEIDRLMIFMPPGSGKSTIQALCFLVHRQTSAR